MRFRLWAQIGLALAVNLVLLLALGAAAMLQQTRKGVESYLLAPARERMRELGRQVEEEFPGKVPAERSAWLERIELGTGARLAVYDEFGELVAGPLLAVPSAVLREMSRPPRRGPDSESDAGPPRRGGPPMFLVQDGKSGQFWLGYHFPLEVNENAPPRRYTLAAVAPSIFGAPLLIDWRPWLVGFAAAMLVTVCCWIPLIRRVTRSIEAVRRASAAIAEGRFDVEIPIRGQDEFGELAGSVRRMAEQLARLVHGQRRFLADVAHELCAPLARIQLSAGILEQRASTAEAIHVERLERDVAHMSALVGDLLSFTKAAVRKPELAPVALAELINRAVKLEGSPEVTIRVEVLPSIQVLAEPEYLFRAISNLLRNAIRYAGAHGPIAVRAERLSTTVRITVLDSGTGLADGELEAIFSPFYRPDAVRTPGTAGAGLGLAIVKSCVEACQGTVSCRNRKPSGLEVTMEFKLAR